MYSTFTSDLVGKKLFIYNVAGTLVELLKIRLEVYRTSRYAELTARKANN